MADLTQEQKSVADSVMAETRAAMAGFAERLRAAGLDEITSVSIPTHAAMIVGWNAACAAARNEGRDPMPKRFIDMAKCVIARGEIQGWIKVMQWRYAPAQKGPSHD